MILPRLNGISPLAIVPRGYFPYPTDCHFINPFSAAGKFAAKLACFATKHLFERDSYRVQSLSIAVIRVISSVCNVFE